MKKKLIEVALPLEAINNASAREKSIRHGHPSTLHLWWARRPLAAARAVIFAQMVDDPSALPDLFPTPKLQQKERERLFRIIEDLVKWENTTNEQVLERARAEIWQSWRRACADNADHPRAKELFNRQVLPAFHDPFAGGGALPLEAQRLGLESHASDLNPVAVLINKAMIEIPPKFAGRPPVNPEYQRKSANERALKPWLGAQGLADDVRYYGQWMRDEAEKRIGHLYPKVMITPEMVAERPDLRPYQGQALTVIAWIWARTVKSPNPAFAHVNVPLASTFMLSKKDGKAVYVEPIIEGDGYRFVVNVGKPKDEERTNNGTKLARGANFQCVLSGAVINDTYIKAESMGGRMGSKLMAIVADGTRGRVYLDPTPEHETASQKAQPWWKPDMQMNRETSNLVSGRGYGFFTWSDLFTNRQLVALTTFSDLVGEAIERVYQDAVASGAFASDVMTSTSHTPNTQSATTPLADGGTGARAYAQAVGVYLGFVVSRQSVTGNSLVTWNSTAQKSQRALGRQALPMVWDYSDTNPFGGATGSVEASVELACDPLKHLGNWGFGKSTQQNATIQIETTNKIVSTDPPYYDNIGYADLSDFFYVWLRRSLRSIFPDLFATLEVPKSEELVATPYRHGGKEQAEAFFLNGMTQAMQRLVAQSHPGFPVTIYYAFKQAETESSTGTASTGWETFLAAVVHAGFSINGTWPVRTEMTKWQKGNINALASSIVLVCRQRDPNAQGATRREFVADLKAELPTALRLLQQGNIAPVDLAQAAIGPGMAVYTRFASVLNPDGSPVPVREALALINQVLDETLAEQEGDFDSDSRFALAWFEQYGFADGDYGVAETLSNAKNTSVAGLANAGILDSKRGKVRLLRPSELPADWHPTTDTRLTNWETVHHLIRVLEAQGEHAAATLVTALGSHAETARELAYRLYTICERKNRANEARSYNALVQSFPEMLTLARTQAADTSNSSTQRSLFE